MPGGDGGESAACFARCGPARALLSAGVPGRPRPLRRGDGGGDDGGCGPGGAEAHSAAAGADAGGTPPLTPRRLRPPLPRPGGGAGLATQCELSPCSRDSLGSLGSPSPKSPAERGPWLCCCGGGGDDGCGAQSWWMMTCGECEALSCQTLSLEASPPRCCPPHPLFLPGPGCGGDGACDDDDAGCLLWTPSFPPTSFLLSAPCRCPGTSDILSVRTKKKQEDIRKPHCKLSKIRTRQTQFRTESFNIMHNLPAWNITQKNITCLFILNY